MPAGTSGSNVRSDDPYCSYCNGRGAGYDYVRTARGAGIPERIVIARVARNAFRLPPKPRFLSEIGYLMGGAVVSWRLLLTFLAWVRNSWRGIQGNEARLFSVVVVALSFIITIIVVDMLY